MISLRFYPEYIHDNQYIELFYRALEAYGVHAADGLEVRRQALTTGGGPDVIHFQWCPEEIWRSCEPNRLRRARRVAGLWRYLRLARRIGVKVVWTVHDFNHHEGSNPIDVLGYAVLAHAAHLVICHDQETRRAVLRRYRIGADNVVVMPIGNYDGVYPPPRPRAETLARLGLPESNRTLVCFGAIRPYKGFDIAIDALRLLGKDYQLIVAGRPLDPAWGDELRRRAEGLENVRLLLDYASKQELADLVHAADCAVMPYRRITGSSAILASLTIRRGVVVSDLPFFRDLLSREPDAGVLCQPGDVRALAWAIEGFFAGPTENRHAAARRLANHYAWSEVIRPVGDWFTRTFPDRIQVPAAMGRGSDCEWAETFPDRAGSHR